MNEAIELTDRNGDTIVIVATKLCAVRFERDGLATVMCQDNYTFVAKISDEDKGMLRLWLNRLSNPLLTVRS